jgi:hypothetical protein
MIKHFGKESFVTFCQNLRDKKNFVGALYPAYQLSTLEELDEAWQKYIKNE